MKKIIYSIIFLVLSICLGTMCKKNIDTNVFGQTSLERSDQAVKNYVDILTQSNEGWLLRYTDETSEFGFGSYYFAMKFKTNGEVDMVSDIKGKTIINTSYYSLKYERTIELTFTTINAIHYLSNTNIGNIGSGIGGDFAFEIISGNTDSVVLKEKNRIGNKKTITLKKLTKTFSECQTSFIKHITHIDNFNSFSKNIYKIITNANGKRLYYVDNIDSIFRTITLHSFKEDVGGKDDTLYAFIEFVDDGIRIYGNNFTPTIYKWNDNNKNFVTQAGDVIKYVNKNDAFPNRIIKAQFQTACDDFNKGEYCALRARKSYDGALFSIAPSSTNFLNYLDISPDFYDFRIYLLPPTTVTTNAITAPTGKNSRYTIILGKGTYDQYDSIRVDTLDNSKLRFTIVNSPGYQRYLSSEETDATDAQNAFSSIQGKANEFLQLLCSPNGWYFERKGNLIVGNIFVGNSTFLLTLVDDPDIYVMVYGTGSR